MARPEIELKFCVPDVRTFQEKATEAGFWLQTPRTLERNALLDTAERRLLGEHQLLRIRQYGERWVVTHKRPTVEEDAQSRYKRRLETETSVADGEAMEAIFGELGYLSVFRYEKFRTEFEDTHGPGHLVLDETPIGNFAELEGEPAWIERALERLGVSPDLCFTDSYGRMFLDWKSRSGSPAENMTFAEIESTREMAGAR